VTCVRQWRTPCAWCPGWRAVCRRETEEGLKNLKRGWLDRKIDTRPGGQDAGAWLRGRSQLEGLVPEGSVTRRGNRNA
jgi:hypothetical protein